MKLNILFLFILLTVKFSNGSQFHNFDDSIVFPINWGGFEGNPNLFVSISLMLLRN